MPGHLQVTVGQASDKGRKPVNQDFHGVYLPREPQLTSKGVAVAIADGISSSDVSHIASQAAVTGFLEDYFCTSETWSVKKSVQRVLTATNAWLYAQTRQGRDCYDKDRGYVCTLSALVIKSTTAHLFHVGDSRIYRLRDQELEQLTHDHRLWISAEKSYLSRAMGIDSHLELDYRSVAVAKGDVFLLATDGVYEYVSPHYLINSIQPIAENLDAIAADIIAEALRQGSDDNLTIQIIRIDDLPAADANELLATLTELPFPPLLEVRMPFDGYSIIRPLQASSRSHLFLAVDNESNTQVVIKIPSIDLRGDPAYLERFMMEDWIARRINSAHVLKPCAQTRRRNFLYVVTEFIDGQTLAQWMIDHPKPALETVRGIVEQIGKGLRAFHRLEMLHQDLRPENIMIDSTGTVKIIDFGSTKVAGLMDMQPAGTVNPFPGTFQYMAPEYFLGEAGSTRSDLFSLAVITYQMLTGRLPYGSQIAQCKTRVQQNRLRYDEMHSDHPAVPVWVDDAVGKAVHCNPHKRYDDVAEFLYDLRHPNQKFLTQSRPPLLERNPLLFWKAVSAILAITVLALLLKINQSAQTDTSLEVPMRMDSAARR